MASNLQFLVLLCILSLCMLTKADQNTTINDFVRHTCNRTHELKNLCLSQISSEPRNDLKSNLTGLLMIFVNQSISNFKNDISFLEKEINSNKISRDTKDMLEDCLQNFQIGSVNLRETMEILQTKTGYDAEQLPVGNVGNLAVECFDDFEGTPVPPEWQSRYNASFALLKLSMAMINLITCNRDYACIP